MQHKTQFSLSNYIIMRLANYFADKENHHEKANRTTFLLSRSVNAAEAFLLKLE